MITKYIQPPKLEYGRMTDRYHLSYFLILSRTEVKAKEKDFYIRSVCCWPVSHFYIYSCLL